MLASPPVAAAIFGIIERVIKALGLVGHECMVNYHYIAVDRLSITKYNLMFDIIFCGYRYHLALYTKEDIQY